MTTRPVCVTLSESPEYTGVPKDLMRQMLASATPPPHFKSGDRYYLPLKPLEDYLVAIADGRQLSGGLR